jgi:hypothetical protein
MRFAFQATGGLYMNNSMLIVLGVVVLVALLVIVLIQQRRRMHLKRRFGPEYDRAIEHHRDLRAAEHDLKERERRVAGMKIRALDRDDAVRFSDEWRRTQTRFVDDPEGAVRDADQLVADVMRARGYPTGDVSQRATDISVDHPRVVSHYRAACDVAARLERGQASTEELRQAIVHYRELFTDLLPAQPELRSVAGGRR